MSETSQGYDHLTLWRGIAREQAQAGKGEADILALLVDKNSVWFPPTPLSVLETIAHEAVTGAAPVASASP